MADLPDHPADRPVASTPRATRRPDGVAAPSHWKASAPPAPACAAPAGDPDGLDPTRFGDWELKGIAIDF